MGPNRSRDSRINSLDNCEEPEPKFDAYFRYKRRQWYIACVYDLRSRLAIVIAVTLIFGILLPVACLQLIYALLRPLHYTCSVNVRDRVPCLLAGVNASREHCLDSGCCWNDASTDQGQPFCFHFRPSKYDYVVTSNRVTSFKGSDGGAFNQTVIEMTPRYDEDDEVQRKPFGKSMLNLKLTVDRVTNAYVRIRATPKDDSVARVDSPWPDLSPSHDEVSWPLYDVELSSENERFTLEIFRSNVSPTTTTAIVSLTAGPLIMTDDYLEFTIRTPTANVYGLGQSDHVTLKRDMQWQSEQLFVRAGGSPSYGVHPMYVCVEDGGLAHGVVLELAEPTDVSFQPRPSLSFRSSGGLIGIHLFLGPTPADVVRQVTELIGKPSLPPPWALGYHTCRSEGNASTTLKVAEDLRAMHVPHESDCGYSTLMKYLGRDEDSLAKLKNISDVLDRFDIKLVLHLSPQIVNGTKFARNNDADDEDVFIRDPVGSGRPYYGLVDGRDVVYPDFSRDDFQAWFAKAFQDLRDGLDIYGIGVDGLFLVDNTAPDETNHTAVPCGSNQFHIPVVAEYLTDAYHEAQDTICLNALQGSGRRTSPHYVNHNRYGYDHVQSVSKVLSAEPGNTSLTGTSVLASLSTFSGSGHYAGHWGGEVSADWNTLKTSLIQLMEFNLYGIPLVGVPICGFRGEVRLHKASSTSDYDPGLCWRWMQLGSLSPLAFTHYGADESPREPNYFSADFQTMSSKVMQLRYSLFPYFYTLLHDASVNGDPVLRPFFYEYPTDKTALTVDEQFLLGPAMMIAPALHPFPSQVDAYFPAGCWYEFETRYRQCSVGGIHLRLIPSNLLPNVFIRGGSMVFQQLPVGPTIDETRCANYTVTVALDDSLAASGSLVLSNTTRVQFLVNNATFTSLCTGDCNRSSIKSESKVDVSTVVSNLILMGVLEKPKVVKIDFNVDITFSMVYDDDVHSMELRSIAFDLTSNLTTIEWSG